MPQNTNQNQTKNSSKEELLTQIRTAKKSGDFDAFLVASQKALSAYPSDQTFLSFLHEAQENYINSKLQSDLLKALEDKQDYKTLYSVYLKLLTVFPDSQKLQKLIKKAEEKIHVASEEQKKDYYKNAELKILDLINQEKLPDAERACYEILSQNQEQKTFISLLAKIQSRLDKQMNKDLELYYKTAIPALNQEFTANPSNFIRI
ncbi:MAG: hypothetical protein WC897_03285 [Candidatus Gracilibacteria bacterium]